LIGQKGSGLQARRQLLFGAVGAGLLACVGLVSRRTALAEHPTDFAVTHTDEEWRRLLQPAQYDILRRHGTERPGSSALAHEFRSGIYSCAGCGSSLFTSETKFDSGTGWPSFWKPIDGVIGASPDDSFFMRRTEVHCHQCGGHLGHVFDDGPPPTGLRYCINGAALSFRAA
jgi:peptide-methionine (R)-S-oxide reductase